MLGHATNSCTFIKDPSWGHLVMLDIAAPQDAGLCSILEGDPRMDVVIAIRPYANTSCWHGGGNDVYVLISPIRDWIEEVISLEVILASPRCIAENVRLFNFRPFKSVL